MTRGWGTRPAGRGQRESTTIHKILGAIVGYDPREGVGQPRPCHENAGSGVSAGAAATSSAMARRRVIKMLRAPRAWHDPGLYVMALLGCVSPCDPNSGIGTNGKRAMWNTAEAMDEDGVDVSLLVAAGGAEVVDRFFRTSSEMARPNWAANLAVQVYRAMREAERNELRSPVRTTGSAQAAGTRASDRAW